MLEERWLRFFGLGAWLFAGSTSIVRLGGHHPVGWTAAFLAFGALFWIGSDRRASRPRRLAALGCQAALAVLLATLGMPHFEGTLLALVAVQVPMRLSFGASVAWVLVQAVPLWLVVTRRYDDADVAKSLGGYLGFSAFAIAVVRKFASERRAHTELGATRATLAESARVAERARISRELHDVLGHRLTALSIHLDVARRTADIRTRAPLDEAHATAKRTLADVRNTVAALSDQETVDLAEALRTMARAIPEPRVELDVSPSFSRIEPAHAHAALRCVQEAVTNVLRHADATLVRVAVKLHVEGLDIRVEDDGQGGARPGNGLRGMRQRIEVLGGTLEVDSVQGRGTTVLAHLPPGAPGFVTPL